MIWIIATALVSLFLLIVLVSVARDPAEDEINLAGALLLWLLGTGVVGCVLGLLLGIVTLFFGPSGVTEVRTDLRAFGNNTETSASFFLGSGYVDSEAVFQYIEQDANGGNHLESVDADRATIYEDEMNAPYLVTHREIHTYPLWVPGEGWMAITGYDFHIPEDSINTEYRVSVTD